MTTPTGIGALRSDAEIAHALEPLCEMPAAPVAGTNTDRPLILVVEPNLETNRLIAETLSDQYRIAAARDGRDGFDKARRLKPDLILTDTQVGVTNGSDFLQAVRQLAALDSIPVVLLAPQDDGERQAALSQEGAQDYLVKPFAPEELRLRVKSQLDAKLARDALRASEDRFHALFDQATDGVVIGEIEEGRCLAVNAAFCRLLDFDREDLRGQPFGDLLPSEDRARFLSRLRPLDGGPSRIALQLKRSDDTWLPVEVTVTLLADGHWQALVRDTSELLRIEEALRLSEAKFSGIYSVAADAIISIDEAHRITMFNDGAESIFGYTAAEIVGTPLEALIPQRYRDAHREHIDKISEGAVTSRGVGARSTRIYGRRKNGEEFPTDAAISRLEVGGKRLLTVSIRDVSESLRGEEEQRLLAEAGEILVNAGSDYERLLTDIANVIVRNIADWCAVDIVQDNNVRRLRIVHSDPAKAAICEALEHFPVDLQQPNLVSVAINTKRSILVSEPSAVEVESLAHSAEHLQLLRAFDPGSLIVVPLIARGNSLGTLAFGSARSSRRYGPRDLREAEQLASRVAMAVDNARLHEALERAIQARDDVLGIVAHDLRNPLNTIMLTTQSLRRRNTDHPERRDQSNAQRIHRSALSMQRLIGDLLDVTQLEAGHSLWINRTAIATQDVLAEAVDRQQAASADSHHNLCLEAAAAPANVWADRTRLLQVFDNLIGNALKFARKRITVGARAKGSITLFWVSDDGPGVASHDLQRLFDRFWQASKSDRRGAGLGLSIVQGIINAHGGRIWAESEVDAGATFYFTLPTAPVAPPIPAEPPPDFATG
jgi:PAS domain S-box-containing protein